MGGGCFRDRNGERFTGACVICVKRHEMVHNIGENVYNTYRENDKNFSISEKRLSIMRDFYVNPLPKKL